jgi:hypothetical protein
MQHRKLSHVVAVGTLMALLALPGTGGIWGWLTRLWQQGISALGPSTASGQSDAGLGFDPNG